MDIERVQLLRTLKTDKVWKKGTIFDAKKDGRPIPAFVIAEVRANKPTVKVLKPSGGSRVEPETAKKWPPLTLAELKDGYPDLVAELKVEVEIEIESRPLTLAELRERYSDLVAEIEEAKEPEAKEPEAKEPEAKEPLTGAAILRMNHGQVLELFKDEKDFESLKTEKRTVLVGIATKRFVK